MKIVINLLLLLSRALVANGQPSREVNYDETKIPPSGIGLVEDPVH